MTDRVATPQELTIDPCTHCQLHCPKCPNTGLGHPPGMGWGRLRFDHFVSLLEGNPGVKSVYFECFGEAYLNKELVNMLEYSARHGVRVRFSSANFNHVSEILLGAIVRFGVEVVSVAFEGITPETYATYRHGGNLLNVIANIEKLNALKRQYNTTSPRLVWLWVVFGHNQHEIPMAKKLAKKWNMEFRPRMQWDSNYSPIRDPEQLRLELNWESSTREQVLERTGNHPCRKTCYALWRSPRINWDGKVLGCCWTQEGFGGNVLTDGYAEAINTERISYARDMLLGKAPARSDIPCSNCELYRSLAENQHYLNIGEIEQSPADVTEQV